MYTEPMNAKELLAAVLQLDEVDRELIRDALTASLPDEDDEDPGEVERSWSEELARRSKAIDDGTAELLEWSDVQDQFRERIAAYRSRRG